MNIMIKKYKKILKDDYEWYTTNISNDGMAMSLELASFMYLLCDTFKFETLMDRGSGFGSFVLRKYAKENDAKVFSIDDNSEWLDTTKTYLKMHNLNTDNLYLWEKFYDIHYPVCLALNNFNMFDFILEDASTNLRVSTADEVISFLEEDGVMLYDDAHYNITHQPIIKRQAKKLEMYEYDIKKITKDSYSRFGALITRKNIDWLEKIT